MLHNRTILGATLLLLFFTYRLLGGDNAPYETLFCNPVPILWTGIVISALILSEHFGRRTWNGALYAGKGRIAVLRTRIFLYYCLGLFIECLPLAVRLGSFFKLQTENQAENWLVQKILTEFGLHILVCLALLSIPLIFCFLFREILWSTAASAGHLFVLLFLMEKVRPEEGVGQILFRIHPAYQMLYGRFLLTEELDVWAVLLTGIAYIGAGILTALLSFWKLELK